MKKRNLLLLALLVAGSSAFARHAGMHATGNHRSEVVAILEKATDSLDLDNQEQAKKGLEFAVKLIDGVIEYQETLIKENRHKESVAKADKRDAKAARKLVESAKRLA